MESESCNGHGKSESPDVVACPECRIELTGVNTLREHMQPGFYLRKDLCCRKCLAVFASECSFQAHLRIHENEAPFVCPECGLEFSSGLLRDQHMLIHRDERWLTKAWMCPVCYKHYNNTTILLSHMIAVHTELLFSCEPCNRLLHSVSAFERHCQQKHGKEAERQPNLYYACGILTCSWKTRSREELKLHFDGHLTVPSDLPRCFCCGRIYQTEADLVKHQTTYHTKDAISEHGYGSAMCVGFKIAKGSVANCYKAGELVCGSGSAHSRAAKKARFGPPVTTMDGGPKNMMTALLEQVQMPLSCRCCGMMAPEKKILLEHGQDHIKAGNPVCLLCRNVPMENELALRQHLKIHSQKDLRECKAVQSSSGASSVDYFSALRVLHLQA